MNSLKAKFEKEKTKLEILKHMCMQEDCHLEDCFVVKKKEDNTQVFFDINQNLDALFPLLASFLYPNAQMNFFVELFNFYQNLPKYKDYPYRSYSQSITTYCLKEMEQRGLIRIEDSFKDSNATLEDYMEFFGNFQYRDSYVSMHTVLFYKLRSFQEEDLSFLQNIIKLFSIDFSDLRFEYFEGKMFIKLNSHCVCHQIFSKNMFGKIWKQRKNIVDISSSYFDYIIGDDFKRMHRK